MADGMKIRASVIGDLPAIDTLYPDVFPDEDLLPVVKELLQEETKTLSLVGTIGGAVISHVIFTACSVTGTDLKVALLGPLGVAPEFQKRGFGSAIVRDGLQRLENSGVCCVYVLGDPAYYSRLGFMPEADVTPPYPLPAEWEGAWQSLGLGKAEAACRGELCVPQPWRKPALWTT